MVEMSETANILHNATDRSLVLMAEDQRTVSADRKIKLLANEHREVAVSSHTRVGQIMTLEAGQEVHLKAGASLTLAAGAGLNLMAGGQHVMINSAGIYASSPILPGGAATLGTPALPAATSGLARRHIRPSAPNRSPADPLSNRQSVAQCAFLPRVRALQRRCL